MSEFASTYDKLAPRSDNWASAVVPPLRVEWTEQLGAYIQSGGRVVELGCGTGVPVGDWLASRYDYTGVGASEGMLATAHLVLPSAPLVHGDMEVFVSPRITRRGHRVLLDHPRPSGAPRGTLRAGRVVAPSGGVFVASPHSHDKPDDYEPEWLGAEPMRWSGDGRHTNLELITAAGLEVIESEVIEQIEPGGLRIRPLLPLARRPA